MKILILKSFGLGNQLMMTPMARALHEAGHELYLLADAGPLGGPYKDIFGPLEFFKEMRGFDRRIHTSGDEFIQWAAHLNLDLAIQSWPGDANWDWLLTFLKCEIRQAPKVDEYTQHEVDYNFDLVRDLIGEDPSNHYSFNIEGAPSKVIQSIIDDVEDINFAQPYICLCPGFKKEGEWHKKNWGISNYAKLATLLIEEGKQVVILDGLDGMMIGNSIRMLEPRARNLTGLTTIHDAAWILKHSFAVFANDCGLAHLAAAVCGPDTPIFTFFGPTSDVKNKPIGANIVILRSSVSNHNTKPGDNWDGNFSLTVMSPSMIYGAYQSLALGNKEAFNAREKIA